jgi:hypothetical protein
MVVGMAALLLAGRLVAVASEFVVRVSLQAEGSFGGPFEDIQWNDRITETMNTVLRYRIEDHGTWFNAEAAPFQVDSSRSVTGGGEYDDGAFGQCTWMYLEDSTTEGQQQGATAGLNVDMTPGNTSANCGVFVIWPGVKTEDTGCTGPL